VDRSLAGAHFPVCKQPLVWLDASTICPRLTCNSTKTFDNNCEATFDILIQSISCVSAMSLSEETPLQAVQLEALTVMKTIKHCATRHPATATGFLVGMDNGGLLEITNCFPFPVVDLPPEAQYEQQHFNSAAAAPRAKANTAYQAEMIRMQKEVGVDANNVGWYTSANLGNFINSNFIENQYFYQKEVNERTVALVHDVSRSSQGALSMRAFRLSSQFIASYKESKFTTEAYVALSLSTRPGPIPD